MCGCKKHLDESQQCTCICDEHANFEAARDLAMRRFDAIRELEAERDAALSTIANVEALHTSEGWPLPGGRESKEYCTRCNCRWPCPTIRALGSVPSTGDGNDGDS